MFLSNVTVLQPQPRNKVIHWEKNPFYEAWPQAQQKIPSGVTKVPRKKKRVRTNFTTQQLKLLEEIFSKAKYIDPIYRKELAQSLQLGDKCIKIWFQNRRMKEKRDSSDSTLDFSSGNSTCESPPTPVNYFKEDKNCEIIIKPEEAPSVPEYQINIVRSSDYQITNNQQLQNEDSDKTHSNMYATEYYPSYGSEYYSNISNKYLNQKSEYVNNFCNGSWYSDANNYFYCNN